MIRKEEVKKAIMCTWNKLSTSIFMIINISLLLLIVFNAQANSIEIGVAYINSGKNKSVGSIQQKEWKLIDNYYRGYLISINITPPNGKLINGKGFKKGHNSWRPDIDVGSVKGVRLQIRVYGFEKRPGQLKLIQSRNVIKGEGWCKFEKHDFTIDDKSPYKIIFDEIADMDSQKSTPMISVYFHKSENIKIAEQEEAPSQKIKEVEFPIHLWGKNLPVEIIGEDGVAFAHTIWKNPKVPCKLPAEDFKYIRIESSLGYLITDKTNKKGILKYSDCNIEIVVETEKNSIVSLEHQLKMFVEHQPNKEKSIYSIIILGDYNKAKFIMPKLEEPLMSWYVRVRKKGFQTKVTPLLTLKANLNISLERADIKDYTDLRIKTGPFVYATVYEYRKRIDENVIYVTNS